jgi:uncharacterized OB-fold protein
MKKSPIKDWREQKDKYSLLGKKGRILSVSCVVQPPAFMAPLAPYWVGVIKFYGKRKAAGQIVSAKKEPQAGDRVVGVMRRMVPPSAEEIINYGVKFKVL